jgi:hypothetical protein
MAIDGRIFLASSKEGTYLMKIELIMISKITFIQLYGVAYEDSTKS